MNRFSIGQAWSHATGFFSGNAANHAIVIIGVGILIPLVLQLVLVGNPMENAFNPALMAGNPQMMAGLGAGVFLMSLLSYVLQFGSYYSSWRLGYSNPNDLPGGLRFGMIAGAVMVGLMIATIIVMALLAYATSPLIVIPLLLVLMVFFVIMYPWLFGFMAIVFVLIAAFGSYALSSLAPMMGGGDSAGGGGIMIVVLLLVGALLLWLSARLSCTAPSMADQGEFLPFNALKRSWAMTAEGQWRIVGYFLLIGVVLFVLAIVLALAIGSSFQSMMMGGEGPGIVTILVMTVLVSIPMAYFTVAIPAGIYRAIGHQSAGDVFA